MASGARGQDGYNENHEQAFGILALLHKGPPAHNVFTL